MTSGSIFFYQNWLNFLLALWLRFLLTKAVSSLNSHFYRFEVCCVEAVVADMTVDLAFAYLGYACHDAAAHSDKRVHTELRGRILGRHQRFTAYDLKFVFQ